MKMIGSVYIAGGITVDTNPLLGAIFILFHADSVEIGRMIGWHILPGLALPV